MASLYLRQAQQQGPPATGAPQAGNSLPSPSPAPQPAPAPAAPTPIAPNQAPPPQSASQTSPSQTTAPKKDTELLVRVLHITVKDPVTSTFTVYYYGTLDDAKYKTAQVSSLTAIIRPSKPGTIDAYEFVKDTKRTVAPRLDGDQIWDATVTVRAVEEDPTSVPQVTNIDRVSGATGGPSATDYKSKGSAIKSFDATTPATGYYHCALKPSASTEATCTAGTPSNKAHHAGIAVLAILLLFALGALITLILRRRKQPPVQFTASPPDDSAYEKQRIAVLEEQLATAQQNVLISAAKQPALIDDRNFEHKFNGINNEIKDWCVVNLQGNSSPGQGLKQLLQRTVPNYAKLLAQSSTKILVLRAAVAAVLAEAFDMGDLFPGGRELRAVEKGMKRNMSESEFNSWRCTTYTSILSSMTSEVDYRPTLEPLAQHIEELFSPFMEGTNDNARRKNYPKDQSKFQDKKLGGIIFPGVEKWGSGEFGPEAQWESCEVVCKARVFV
ncbi:Protein of unknown function [Pyronema omphalodes CBS 100304]|uniref:Uncharacterized protein n=1 Tax=Pyronema omphalodes (strain CBS 100304) TaxID=1076935 RepID=U4LGI1_PYROM|nr:Protein of unknown function [Pyronema omphalodes CBS 100304]